MDVGKILGPLQGGPLPIIHVLINPINGVINLLITGGNPPFSLPEILQSYLVFGP